MTAPRLACALAFALALTACPDEVVVRQGLTGVRLTMNYPVGATEHLRVWAVAAGEVVEPPALVPEGAAVLAGGEDSLVICCPTRSPTRRSRCASMASGPCTGALVGSGAADATVRAGRLVDVLVGTRRGRALRRRRRDGGRRGLRRRRRRGRRRLRRVVFRRAGLRVRRRAVALRVRDTVAPTTASTTNTGDGATDLADPGCDDAADPSERGDSACDDGIDDDHDGATDFHRDGSGRRVRGARRR